MKDYRYLNIAGAVEYESHLEPPPPDTTRRISPRSYYGGRGDGLLIGLPIGWLIGIITTLALMAAR